MSGMIEDTRKLMQDFLAPELKGIQTQVSALEKSVDARFDAVDARFDAVDSRFNSLEKSIDVRFDAVNARFDSLEKSIDDRLASQTKIISAGHDMLMAEMRSLTATVSSSLTVMNRSIQDIDKRLQRLEDQQPKPTGPMLVQRP